MRKRNIITIIVIVLVILLFFLSRSGIWRAMRVGSGQAKPVVASQKESGSMPGMPGMAAEPPAGQTTASPGEATGEAPTVEIPADKQQLIGLKTTVASVQPLTKTIRTVGLVEYDQRKLNTINAKVEGWVEKLYVNFTGSYVKKGQPVAEIYSPELWATQQEFINTVKWAKQRRARAGSGFGLDTRSRVNAQARAGSGLDIDTKNRVNVQGADPIDQRSAGLSGNDLDVGSMIDRDAQSLVEATRQRLKLYDISDAQIKKIEESEKPIRTLTVYSPYSGYVLQKNVNQGMRIMPGQALLDVADLSSVWITADIYEFELPLIKVGDLATVQLSYFPGRKFSTKIDYINPTLEGETRTAKARFILPNEGGRLKPQMFANVEMTINLGQKLAVPSDAVINTGVRKIAYVDKGDGNFEPREVLTGVQTEKLIEITEGLKAGDKVASSANFLIDSEAKLKGVEALPRQKPGQKQTPVKPASTASMPQHKH